MVNTYITEPADKISFVRSRLQDNSYASSMMQASSFLTPLERKDYTLFRETFLSTFGCSTKHSLVRAVDMTVDSLLKSSGTKARFLAQVEANRLSRDSVRILRDSKWGDSDNISMANLQKFLEFLYYMIVLTPKERKSSLSLTYNLTDRLHDFVLKLDSKVEEKQGESWSAARVAAVPASKGASRPIPSSAGAATGATPKVFKCHYCGKEGHIAPKCIKRIRDRRDKHKGGAVDTAAKTARSGPTPAKGAPSHRGSSSKSHYCVLHESSSHSTDDCSAVKTLKKDKFSGSREESKNSGEAERPAKTNPS